MKLRFSVLLLLGLLLPAAVQATVVYDQPHDASGTLHKSSWYPPDGLDGDAYSWENFTLAASASITEVRWRGGYEQHPSGTGQSPVYDFEISIFRSIAGGSQPDLGPGGRLVLYYAGGNAGETPAGSFGGVAMNDYAFTLPSPFPASGGTKYWVRIVAWQGAVAPSYAPDWGLAKASGGDGFHFRYITAGMYQSIQQDLAFSLRASSGAMVNIVAGVAPAGAGSVAGAGAYPVGSMVSLQATPNAGHGFANWTEGANVVSTNTTYSFTAGVDRTLVANFVSAWNIGTAAWPPYAGAVTGAGVYNDGATVTLVATAGHGFVFTGWSDGSTTAMISFPASADMILTAFFDSAPNCATFDFDNGSAGSSLPLDFTANGVGAHIEGGYSVQPCGTLGIAPAGMSGLYLYPGSVFPSDLVITFASVLSDFSLLYAPVEIACDNSATIRTTGYLNHVFVATSTTTAPVPGTYPTGTASLVAPTGFNRVVVHWDAAGSRCGDYAPIFLADVVTVTVIPPVAVGDAPGPRVVRLFEPAPNPARGAAAIAFELPAAGEVRLAVYDVTGRFVRSLIAASMPEGAHRMIWDGTDSAGRPAGTGLYVLRLEAAGTRASRRMMLVR
jgi:flagellar hook capping protein FlgD/List-Bact-rpt repeat protein